MIRLLILDLDGTLLRRDKTISAYTRSVLERCRAKGIQIAVATARAERNAKAHTELIQPDILISSNGAWVTMGETVISSCGFTREETKTIIETGFRATNHTCEVTVDTADRSFWNYKTDPHLIAPDWGEVCCTDYTDFQEEALKICIELKRPEEAETIAGSVTGCVWTKFSDGDWYQFTKEAASKWNAVRAISQQTGIAVSDMAAFGNDRVDMEMIRHCGIGVAMENALDEVKQAADDITGTNEEDGVARWLEAHLLT